MPRGVSHDEEFGRISSHEDNRMKTKTGWGPSKRFTEKGQMSNPTTGGGINRSTKGSAKGKGKNYNTSAQ